jgi:hypothetical protein
MGIPGLARSGLAGKDCGERAGARIACFVSNGAGGQALEGGLDGCEVVEAVETVGAAAEFARGLGAAEHEKAEDGGLVAAKIEDRADAMLVLGDAGVVNRGDQGEIFKRVDGLPDIFFGEIEHGVAAGTLVARVDQSIEGERIVLRRGDLFFYERAQDAKLMGREVHRYKVATAKDGRVQRTSPDWQG